MVQTIEFLCIQKRSEELLENEFSEGSKGSRGREVLGFFRY